MSLYFSVLRPRSNLNDSAVDAESLRICTSSLSCCWSDRDGDDDEEEEEEEGGGGRYVSRWSVWTKLLTSSELIREFVQISRMGAKIMNEHHP